MTSEMMRIIKLSPPDVLPSDTISSVDFKNWRSHAITFLTQCSDNRKFIKGGEYETWDPQVNCLPSQRLKELKGRTDTVRFPTQAQIRTHAMLDQDPAHVPTQEELDDAKADLQEGRLELRNQQLGLMLQQLASCCYKSECYDITDRSDSLDWCWEFLMNRYDIQARGANILRIADKVFPPGGNYMTFYKEFRLMILDNLRLKGSKADPRVTGDKLAEDEKLSPTFEDIIIIWALERIDRRLPAKVRKDYEHRLFGDTFLWDLQAVIFQAIPALLEDLAKEDNYASALAATKSRSQPAAAAAPLHQLMLNASLARPSKGRFGGKGGSKGADNSSTRGKVSAAGGPWTEFYCRICHKIKKQPASVFTTHNTNQCSSISVEDRYCLLNELMAFLGDEYEEDHYQVQGMGEQGFQEQGGDQDAGVITPS